MMLELIIRVVVGAGIAAFLWDVSHSLQEIARDLRIISGRAGAGSKPLDEDPAGFVDA